MAEELAAFLMTLPQLSLYRDFLETIRKDIRLVNAQMDEAAARSKL